MYKFFSISNNQHISERFFLDPAWLPSTRCKGNISRISLKIPPWSLDLSGWIKAPAKLELTKFITLPCSWESIPHTLVVVTIRMQTILNPKSSTFLDGDKACLWRFTGQTNLSNNDMKIAMRNWNAAVECKSALVYNLQKKKRHGQWVSAPDFFDNKHRDFSHNTKYRQAVAKSRLWIIDALIITHGPDMDDWGIPCPQYNVLTT